jgi:hypothetical protein
MEITTKSSMSVKAFLVRITVSILYRRRFFQTGVSVIALYLKNLPLYSKFNEIAKLDAFFDFFSYSF